ncbi:UDP-N-acetylmuramyl-tripeptide synthetase [Proteiniborus sp. DW1]|uniref:Mur ligase family protein n=1 Tax=Proteiniborus sp. DW1 TaxID=1889883 RepID=UPI00092E13D4|nr:UDP-N-acetylmuramoyl-L-alanyl-D-glutamate--2,6-diaminopimelate ligase [Proteiniborus sp. DW1]SCG82619.1 UDP-N-acetylmuramyl-tripeptide synthetase [Proteiniborus sp. DW1]
MMKIDGVDITGVTCDSSKVKKGFAFVAIKGIRKDGNQYINDVIKRGASIIYTEDDIKSDLIPVIKVQNSRKKLAELLDMYYDYPSKKLILVGITGTNGKTTTSYILDHILKSTGIKTGVIGTLGIKIGERHIPTNLTTPEPEVLFYQLKEMVKEDVQVAIIEVSSHGLKLERVYGLDFDMAIHTNIGYDHVNFHKTKTDYIKSKKILFDSLKKNGISIINIDDKDGLKLIEGNTNTLVVSYGLNPKSSITASSLMFQDTISFNLCIQRGLTSLNSLEVEPMEIPISMKLLGRHNVYNSLAAICGALCIGIEPHVIAKLLSNFTGVDRRLSLIYNKDYLIIDDFCHNPQGYEVIFETIQSLNFNRLIIVNSIRGNRGVQINRKNAKVLGSWCNTMNNMRLILTLSKDTTGVADKVKKSEVLAYRSILDNIGVEYTINDNLKDALIEALKIAEKNDLILLLGAQGMDQGKEIIKNILGI